MNSANPFQVPSCFQNNLEQRRRERFKKGVIATIVATVLLLVGLLIEGCKSERASATPASPVAAVPVAPAQPEQKLPAQSISPVPQPRSTVTSQPISTGSRTAAASVSHSPTVYVVKSGDTLTRIAKLHGVTVKAILSVNDLASDRITVGAKLKIPAA